MSAFKKWFNKQYGGLHSDTINGKDIHQLKSDRDQLRFRLRDIELDIQALENRRIAETYALYAWQAARKPPAKRSGEGEK